jgi:hypothetical protein
MTDDTPMLRVGCLLMLLGAVALVGSVYFVERGYW